MKTSIMTIFTRTPLHVGAGSSVGAVDQPVVRERHTRFPVIPGSSVKGVLADLWNERKEEEVEGKKTVRWFRTKEGKELFGEDENGKDVKKTAGKLLLGEGKLLAFPVRSAKGVFAWVTCPLALKRFARDAMADIGEVPSVGDEEAMLADGTALQVEGSVVFEEYPLRASGKTIPEAILKALAGLSAESVWGDLGARLAIVSDDMFRHFAETACELAQHNRIDDETGVVAAGALFNQENVPSETMFYSVVNIAEKDAELFPKFTAKLGDCGNLLQIGADITTGLGWCSVLVKEVK